MNKTKLMLVGVAIGALMLSAPLFAMAADIGDITDNTGSVTVNAYVPHVTLVELQEGLIADDAGRGTALGIDLTDTQLDVHVAGAPKYYGFLVEVSHGLSEADVTNVDLGFYYDRGDDTKNLNPAGAATQNVQVTIDMGTDTPTLVLPTAGDEILFSTATIADFDVRHGMRADNITLDSHYTTIWIRFGFSPFMRWATGFNTAPAGDTHIRANAYNDAFSWNYYVSASDTYSTTETWYGEFGTFKYQSATFYNIDVGGSGAPGAGPIALTQGGSSPYATFQCNAPHQVSVQLMGDLSVDLVGSLFSLSGGDEALAAAAFADTGSTIYATGSSTRYRLMMNYSEDLNTAFAGSTWWKSTPNIAWSLSQIPIGTPEGVYSQAVSYHLTTDTNSHTPGTTVHYGVPLPP